MCSVLCNRRFSQLSLGVLLVAVLVLPASAQTRSLLDYIPEDVVYCKVSEPVGGAPEAPNLRNFEQSLQDWIRALGDIVEWRILQKELASLHSEAELPQDVSMWDLLTGDRCALAVFGLGDGVGLRIPTVLFISQPANLEQAKALLHAKLKRVESYGIPVIRDIRRYEDTVVESLEVGLGIPGLGLAFVTKDDLLFVSTNAPLLDRVLGMPEAESGHLSEDPDFIALQTELPDQYDELSYFSWRRVSSMAAELKKLTAFIPDEKARELVIRVTDQVMGILETLRAVGTVSVWDGEVRKTTSRMLLAEERSELIGAILSRAPRTYPVIQMAPYQTETVWATNFTSLPEIWDIAWNIVWLVLAPAETPQETLKTIQSVTGLDIEEDVLSWMGQSFGAIKQPVDLESVVPINHFALWFEATDEEKATALLPKVAAALGRVIGATVTLNTEEYQGRTCSWIEVPVPFFPYQPTMTTLDGGVVICTSPKHLRDILDAYDDRARGLIESKTYSLVSSMFDKEANLIQYADCARATYGASKAMERAAAMVALGAAHDKNAEKVAYGMRRLAKLVAILGICQTQAQSTSIEGNFIRTEKCVVIEDLPARIILPAEMRGRISLTDMETWLPEAIKGLRAGGQPQLAVVLARWLRTIADLNVEDQEIEDAMRLYRQAFKLGLPKSELESVFQTLSDQGYEGEAEALATELENANDTE